jgi:hypothetical protein
VGGFADVPGQYFLPPFQRETKGEGTVRGFFLLPPLLLPGKSYIIEENAAKNETVRFLIHFCTISEGV